MPPITNDWQQPLEVEFKKPYYKQFFRVPESNLFTWNRCRERKYWKVMILDQLFCYCSFEDGKKTSDMVK